MNSYKKFRNRISKIRLIVFDIDGVLTDGRIYIDHTGHEIKTLNLREIDAVFSLHKRGYLLAAITGENTPITSYFRNRFPWDYYFEGCKNKLERLVEIEKKENLISEQICYIGDGKYDSEAIKYAGIGICPEDGSIEAKAMADIILKARGGYNCVQELEHLLTL